MHRRASEWFQQNGLVAEAIAVHLKRPFMTVGTEDVEPPLNGGKPNGVMNPAVGGTIRSNDVKKRQLRYTESN